MRPASVEKTPIEEALNRCCRARPSRWRHGLAALALLLGGASRGAEPLGVPDPGAALFLHGQGAEVRLGSGALTLPAHRFACAGCHGTDGGGRREGGTDYPAVLWQRLSDPEQQAVPYTRERLARALRDGIAADGRTLSRSMPRFVIDDALLDALIMHLQSLDQRSRQGISARQIRIQPSAHADLNLGFAAAARALNHQGGVFGRRLLLAPAEPGTATSSAITLDQLAARLETPLRNACWQAAIHALNASAVERLRIIGDPDPDLVFRLHSAGIRLDPQAPDALVIDASSLQGSDEDQNEGQYEDQNDRSQAPPLNPAESVKAGAVNPTHAVQHYIGCLDTLGAVATRLHAAGARLTLLLADRAALGWAVANRHSAEALSGHQLAQLLFNAAIIAGRRLTQSRLWEALDELNLEHEVLRYTGAQEQTQGQTSTQQGTGREDAAE